ncbi:MAG: hypothetical protein CMP51_04255 [Flavobacteriales bacterium]|nr:hypothetical protein [Flavobacteriales bacterium]
MMKKTLILVISTLFNLSIISQDLSTIRLQPLGTTVTVTGIATNGSELGVIRYIEDGTAGIALYDLSQSTASPNNYLTNISRGDSITITGELADYNGLLEIYVSVPPTLHSTNNALPIPQLVTPIQIGENTEAELVQIDNAIFSNGGSIFAGNSTHDFTSNGESGRVYIKSGSPLANSLIPMGPVTIIGISSQYINPASPNILTSYQIIPRDSSDIIPGSLIFTTPVMQTNITSNSFDLSWSVSDSSNTNCNFGTSITMGNVINNAGNSLSHSMTLSGLQPATFYFVQCYSIKGIDTAFSNVGIYSTASNSTGKIRPYFNHSVDTSFAIISGTNAQNITTYFNDTIKAYMDLAQSTLDICVYNASDATIASAINDAYNRGVSVRYIADDDVTNSMIGSLNTNIPIVYRNSSLSGIMHNKFVIIDANSVNNSWILSGSTNWTNPSNLFNDYNNLIFIQDQALAKAYTIEFEEMWSGIFGNQKEDNTPHKFSIGGKDVELYFSPSDQTTSKIIDFIDKVDYSLEIGLLSFTRDDIGDKVIEKDNQFGVIVRGIIEQENVTGSEFSNLNSAGVNVRSHTGVQHSFHHKYAIADANVSAANSAVLTGSHNWSTNAEVNSDENTLIIYDNIIANIYLQEFEKRWSELSSTNLTNVHVNISSYPNPSRGNVNLESDFEILYTNIYNYEGKLIRKENTNTFIIDKGGIYFLKSFLKNNTFSLNKVIIQ